jgi:hypothetical protein
MRVTAAQVVDSVQTQTCRYGGVETSRLGYDVAVTQRFACLEKKRRNPLKKGSKRIFIGCARSAQIQS